MKTLAATLLGGFLSIAVTLGETPLISKGAPDWKYSDQGTAPEENWTSGGFDDSGWASGSAPLGYETDDGSALKTTVSYGDDAEKKHVVTYFRKSFDITDLGAFSKAAMRIAADDGAVVYLNGKEIGRVRMVEGGAVTESTLAAVKNSGAEVADHVIEVPSESLVQGKNVLAISVHQAGPTSSDLFLDLDLVGVSAKEFAEVLFEPQMRQIMAGYQAELMEYSTAYRAAADDEARAALKYPSPKEAADAMTTLVLENPEHPAVIDAASWLAQNRGFTDVVSDLIAKHHARSESEGFAMLLVYSRYRPDPGMMPLLTKVRAEHPNKSFQSLAAFSLSNSAKESQEKEALLEEAEAKIGDFVFNNRPIKPMIMGELFEMRNLSIGQVAPEIEGEDIDGVAFKLSDYRGKVVVLDFWGHW